MVKTEHRSKKLRVQCSMCCDSCTAASTAQASDSLLFHLCETCEEFCKATATTKADVCVMKKKAAKKFATLQAEQQEWRQNKASKSDTPWGKQDIVEETEQTSTLQESYLFLSRDKFKAKFGVYPDQAKVQQVRALNKSGDTVIGVAFDTGEEPRLVLATTRRLRLARTIFKGSEDHFFQAQAEQLFAKKSVECAMALGQEVGSKYKPKNKAVTAYSEEDIQTLIASAGCNKLVAQRSALEKMVEGDECSGSSSEAGEGGRDGEDDAVRERAGSKQGNDDMEPGRDDDQYTDAAGSPRPQTIVQTPLKEDDSQGSQRLERLRSSASLGSPAVKSARSGDRSRSPAHARGVAAKVALSKLAPSKVASAPSCSGEADDEEKAARRKTADYWMKNMTADMIFSGHNLNRQMRWARACASRMTSAGESLRADRLSQHLDMIQECETLMVSIANPDATFEQLMPVLDALVRKNTDFVSAVKVKLLAKRLSSMVQGWSRDVASSEIDLLVSTLAPFTDEADEEGASEIDIEDSCRRPLEETVGDTIEFDPKKPTLKTIEGSLNNKLLIALRVWWSDVVRPLLQQGGEALHSLVAVSARVIAQYEAGIADMAEVPATALETLTLFRVLLPLADSTLLEFDSEPIDKMRQETAKNKMTKLGELGALLKANDFWRHRVNELVDLVANQGSLRNKLRDAIATMSALTQIAELTKLWPHMTDLLEKARVYLRKGATHLLEVAIGRFLQEFVLENMRGGNLRICDKDHGVDLADLKEIFEAASNLWPEEPSYSETVKRLSESLEAKGQVEQAHKLFLVLDSAYLAVSAADSDDEHVKKSTDDVINFVDRCDSLTIPPDMFERMLDACRNLAGHMLNNFPAAVDMAKSISKVVEPLTSLPAATDLMLLLKILDPAGELNTIVMKYNKLGIDDSARAAADEQNTVLRELMHKKMQVQAAMDMAGEKYVSEVISKLLAYANLFICRAGDVIFGAALSDLDELLASTTTWAGGGQNGTPWHMDLNEQSAWAEVLLVARRTLMNESDPHKYSTAKVRLKEALKRVQEASSMFEIRTRDNLVDEVTQLIKRLGIVNIEGLLCALFAATMPKEEMKSKLHGIKRLCRPSSVVWDDLFGPLRDRAMSVSKLQV